MALADITLNDGQGTPVAHTFEYVTTENGRVVRKDMTRTPDLPLTLTLGHQKAKRNGVAVDSHLVRFDDARMDADGVTVRYGNVRIMVDQDPQSYSDAVADDYAAFIRNFATSANFRSLMKGSVF